MSRRLKVLICAYACEPGKGSEPEVGWQWALQMALFHDVTVVTRANNRPAIEAALEPLRSRQEVPVFVYHDRGPLLLDFKRRFKAIKLYYLLWQKSAWELVEMLHKVHQYDLMHHVTFAGFRYPTAIWGHGVPSVWGPIGGIESVPTHLLPWHHLGSLLFEVIRNFNNLVQATPFHVLPKRARATTLILASTPEMRRVFDKLGFVSRLMPTIGLNPSELPFAKKREPTGPLRLLYVGNIITLKGVDLALEALKASQTAATFTLIGSGNYLEAARRQARRMGLETRVTFAARLPREEVLKAYADFDVFLLPSLHDTGGYSVIEAMFNELPVICLDCGGPAVAVEAGCGTKVPLGARTKVIAGLATAIRRYDQERDAIRAEGKAARAAVLRKYEWNSKGAEMNECYQEALARFRTEARQKVPQGRYPGMGRVTHLAHHMFSVRGLIAAAAGLLMVGALGFLSIDHLKREAGKIVHDTLPGLTYAGAANASLAQGFNRTLMYLITEDKEQDARLRNEIETFNRMTTQYLATYKQAIFETEDRKEFEELWQHRREYLKIRERVFSLVEAGRRREAIELCERELSPAFLRYKASADELFQYNMRQGQSRGENIMASCTVTQLAVAGIVIGIFVVGFFIGMFK